MSDNKEDTKAMQGHVAKILRRIVPWLSEHNVSDIKYRSNYKGVRGRIGIVGGSRDYAGAPYFASISAMRLGADLAYVICSKDASQVIKNYSPDLIVNPMLDHPDEEEFDEEMDRLLTRLHALVVGPGLGREKLLQNRAKKLIEQAKARSIPLILDADSLLLVDESPEIVKSYPKALLTPNRIELQRMLNRFYSPKNFDLRNMAIDEIRGLVRECSSYLNVSILAKGLVDIVCDSETTPLEMCTDGLSGSNRRCGGQGDITCGLAGVLIHWIDQANKEAASDEDIIEHTMAWAGYLAVILTRRCNELAYREHKSGMLASDMINKVSLALESMLKDKGLVANSKMYQYTGYLSISEVKRYSRQIIMDEFGPARQLKLKQSSALIIGAGGLGCPAAVYLGAAGIGRIGVVDDDRVEVSNLHRQILHNMDKVGMLKTESIKQAVEAINPYTKVVTHSVKMDRFNAVNLIEQYDVILDCTDNLLARYMISDASVVAKKPLISGAALKLDGQLTVYNYNNETPCFRCLFPIPPPPNAVGSCSDNGVMGVVPGIIGVQQAFEAIKIAAGMEPAYGGKMLLYDGQLGVFRHVTIGKRKNDCAACGDNSKISRSLMDYNEFCGQSMCKSEVKPSNILDDEERITVEQYSEIIKSKRPHILVDVRPRDHSDISRFKHALQMPVTWMVQNSEDAQAMLRRQIHLEKTNEIFVVCRKGIASQKGTRVLQDLLKHEYPPVVVKDILGGMTTWATLIDPNNYACL